MSKKIIFWLHLSVIIFSSSFISGYAGTLVANPVGDGIYNEWESSVGVSNYSLVNESSCNGDTDYVSANEVGERDSYVVSLAGVPDGATITSIAITPCASRSNNGSNVAGFDIFYRLNSVNSADTGSYLVSGNVPVPLATTTFQNISVVKSSSSSLEIGAVFTSGKKRVRLSKISSVITYTPAPVISTVSTSSLISYYSFEGNSNDQVSSNHGTNTSISYTSGKINNGATFNGFDSIITAADSSSLQGPTSTITISAWMKVNSYTQDNYPLLLDRMNAYTSDGYRLVLHGGLGKVMFSIGTLDGRVDFLSSSTVAIGSWQNWTATYDGSLMKIYLDGVLDASLAVTGEIIYSSNTALGIGARTTGTTQYLDGSLDEIGLWSSALLEDEVTGLYNQGEGVQYPFIP